MFAVGVRRDQLHVAGTPHDDICGQCIGFLYSVLDAAISF